MRTRDRLTTQALGKFCGYYAKMALLSYGVRIQALFEKWQNAVLGHLFPPGLRCLDLKSVRIPASNRLAWQKNLHQSRIPPFFKQGREQPPKNNEKRSAVPESQGRVVVLDGRRPACVLRHVLRFMPTLPFFS